MSAESFLDTNLFVYQLEAQDERKFKIANDIIRSAVASGNACISFQVVQECLNTIVRKAEIALSTEETKAYLENILTPLYQVPAGIPLYRRALDVRARYRYGFYDALIVAAALEAGCKRLYSEDLQHGQQIEGLVIRDPFRPA